MGNANHHYERHEDDEQQQCVVINRDFRLVLGQLDLATDLLTRNKKFLNHRQTRHRKMSSSSSLSCTISTSTDCQPSSMSLLYLDIPTSLFDHNELDTYAFRQYLCDQDFYGKELYHVFKVPTLLNNHSKSRCQTLPTLKLAAIYYDQPSTNNELIIDTVPLFDDADDFQGKFQVFNDKTILAMYTSSKIDLSCQII
jgi:hypothetical protein